MSEENNSENGLEEIEAAFAEREKSIVETTLSAVRGVIAEASAPSPQRIEVDSTSVEAETVEAEAVSVARDMRDAQYQNLPTSQQGLGRSHRFDVSFARWARATARNDHDELQKIRREDQHLRASLLEGDSSGGAPFDGSGGEMLPLPIASFVHQLVTRQSAVAGLVNTLTSPSASVRIPIQSALSTANWVNEGATLSDGSPSVDNALTLVKQKLAVLSSASNEMISDSAFAVTNFLSADASKVMAAALDDALCNGTAGSPLTSSLTASDTAGDSSEYTLAAAGAYSSADVVGMFFALQSQARASATWVANDTVLAELSNLTDGLGRPVFLTQNDPLGAVTDQGGRVGTIMGRPVVSAPLTADRLIFGDIRQYMAALRDSGISAASSTEAGFATDSVMFRFVLRYDAGDMDIAKENRVWAVTS